MINHNKSKPLFADIKKKRCESRRPVSVPVRCKEPEGHPGEHYYWEHMAAGVPIYESTWSKSK